MVELTTPGRALEPLEPLEHDWSTAPTLAPTPCFNTEPVPGTPHGVTRRQEIMNRLSWLTTLEEHEQGYEHWPRCKQRNSWMTGDLGFKLGL